jgi:cytochrome c oxidase cbb3-type subunit IV
MDINTIRAAVTVAALITFLGIVAWAWSSRRRADFEAAARLPLDEGDAPTAREKEQ